MVPPSCIRSIVDRNVFMLLMTVLVRSLSSFLLTGGSCNFQLAISVDVFRFKALRIQ